jgi:hypothetical protein
MDLDHPQGDREGEHAVAKGLQSGLVTVPAVFAGPGAGDLGERGRSETTKETDVRMAGSASAVLPVNGTASAPGPLLASSTASTSISFLRENPAATVAAIDPAAGANRLGRGGGQPAAPKGRVGARVESPRIYEVNCGCHSQAENHWPVAASPVWKSAAVTRKYPGLIAVSS